MNFNESRLHCRMQDTATAKNQLCPRNYARLYISGIAVAKAIF
jgi:hypothetical protein